MRQLLIRPGAIGDCIVSLPALECLRADYTEVWVPSVTVPLIRSADRVCPIASTGIDLLAVTEPYPGLTDRLAAFDSIVSWYGAKRPEFREAVAHLPFEFHPTLPMEATGNTHAVDFHLQQVGCKPGAAPHIDCPRQDRGSIVLHPFSGSRRKNWPLDNFRALARRLERLAPVEWCANPDGSHRIDDLYELARWLAGARLYVGNDSGITHLAAAVGTPVVAIFLATDPRVWAPRGPIAHVLERPGVAEVEDVCVRLLSHA